MSSPVLTRYRLAQIFDHLDQAAAAAGSNVPVTFPLSIARRLLRDGVLVDVTAEPMPIAANDNTEPLRAA